MRRRALLIGAAAAGIIPLGNEAAYAASPWDEVPAILARIVPPTFASRTFDIRDYGAVGNNSTGRTDTGSYLPVVFTRWQGIECYNHSPFIYANGKTNIAITGAGTIDGNAPAGSWSSWGGGGADWTRLQQQGRDNVPVSQRQYGAGTKLRPNMIGLYNCTNLLIEGVNLRNPAMWTLHPVYCTNVTVRNVTFFSTNSQGDGLDLDSCTDAYVSGCRMDTNDDCVVIKSGRDADGRRVGRPTQNVVVENCKFSGRWGGITVGSEMSGGARKIFAQDCQNNAADFPGRYPIKYPLYGTTSGSFIPTVQNFTIDQLTTTNGRSAVSFEGQSDVRIRGVEISNSTFTGMTASNVIEFADVHWINSSINGVPIGDPPPAGTRYEAENATISQGVVESNHAGFSGTGFVNGTTTNRPMSLNGTTVNFPGTGAWTTWSTVTVPLSLGAGTHAVRLTSTTSNGGPNLDYLEVSP